MICRRNDGQLDVDNGMRGTVRHAARYRAQYAITDPADALGPKPEHRGVQQRDWERAREAIERAERRIGREVSPARDIDLGIGL